MGTCSIESIRNQMKFCTELVLRLNDEIQKDEAGYTGMKNHIRKQDDIKRIRRELLTVSKMLNPWGNEQDG